MDELVATVKQWIEKYFNMLPFKRKGVYAKMITEPSKTMEAEAKKTGFGIGLRDLLTGMVPYLILLLAVTLVILVVIVVALSVMGKLGMISPYVAPALGIVAVCFMAYVLVSIIGWILGTAVIHMIAKVLGGKGKFVRMLGLMGTLGGTNSLFMIPVMLVSIIPIVGQVTMLASLYFIYLLYKAIRAVHGIDRNGAIVAIVIPIIIIGALVMAIYVAYIMLVLGLSLAG